MNRLIKFVSTLASQTSRSIDIFHERKRKWNKDKISPRTRKTIERLKYNAYKPHEIQLVRRGKGEIGWIETRSSRGTVTERPLCFYFHAREPVGGDKEPHYARLTTRIPRVFLSTVALNDPRSRHIRFRRQPSRRPSLFRRTAPVPRSGFGLQQELERKKIVSFPHVGLIIGRLTNYERYNGVRWINEWLELFPLEFLHPVVAAVYSFIFDIGLRGIILARNFDISTCSFFFFFSCN